MFFNKKNKSAKLATRPGQTKSRAQVFMRVGFLILFISLSYLGWLKIHNPKTLPISTVNIGGNYQHINPVDLKKIIVPYVDANFFSLNLIQLKNRLMQIPWVGDVEITRIWPSTVDIKIIEQNPVAIWNDSSMLNTKVELFSPPQNTFPTNLVHLYGPVGQQDLVYSMYQQIQTALTPLNLSITNAEMTARGSWKIELNNGVYVILGKQEVMDRLQKLVKLYPKIIGQYSADVNYIDMRYPNGVAVSWKNSSGNSSTIKESKNN